MNVWDILLIVLILGALVLAFRLCRKGRSCCGGCHGCSGNCKCKK